MSLDSTKMDWAKVWDNVLLAGGIILAILKLIWLPLSWILFLVIRIVLIITTPFQWLFTFLYHCSAFPIRFLARFEILFYYFGTACLIGIVTGLILFASTRLIYRFLDLQDEPSLQAQTNTKDVRGRTAASYRAERAQRQAQKALNSLRLDELPQPHESEFKTDSKGWSPGGGLARYPLSPTMEKKGLLSTTIFEEEDSSDYTTI